MKRFFVILGIALMVFAFVILGVFIIAPAIFNMDDAPFLKSILQSVACKPNEELTASYSTYSTPGTTTRSTYLSCVDNENHATDASQQIIGIGAVGYLGPFLIGLFMTLLAGRPSEKTGYSTTSDFNDSAADDRRARVEATRKDMAKLAAQQSMREDYVNPASVHVPLAQRLQELKDAQNAGLITDAEYTAKRTALLNEE